MWNAVRSGIIAAFDAAARPALYRRGNTALDVVVLPGRRAESTSGLDNFPVQHGDADFILAVTALGNFGLPVESDQLILDFGGRLHTYSLTTKDDGTRAWRYVPGHEFVRLSLTLIADQLGSLPDGAAAIPVPAANVRREPPLTRTISAEVPETFAVSTLSQIAAVQVWKPNPDGSYEHITEALAVKLSADGRSVEVTSSLTLTNARVYLIGV